MSPPWHTELLIILVALGTLLTAVTIGVGILALIGWGALRQHASSVAQTEADRAARDEVRAIFEQEGHPGEIGSLADEVED